MHPLVIKRNKSVAQQMAGTQCLPAVFLTLLVVVMVFVSHPTPLALLQQPSSLPGQATQGPIRTVVPSCYAILATPYSWLCDSNPCHLQPGAPCWPPPQPLACLSALNRTRGSVSDAPATALLRLGGQPCHSSCPGLLICHCVHQSLWLTPGSFYSVAPELLTEC